MTIWTRPSDVPRFFFRGESNIYWVRVRVPDRVRDVFDKTEMWKSLETCKRSDAKVLAPAVIGDFKRAFRFAWERKSAATIMGGKFDELLGRNDADDDMFAQLDQ